ncbi:molybdenum cofactor guanylyltransferase MobA [Uliginosibacterium gangwonense]|uniref:molybdenum cofactor guanylyltransferase MobA n=1 Tax=Uliginosibacterium gangwonense TaxID=392736 RepID=UPI000A05D90F|nr:molybdenum cofactor guanylyltransferase MobA [Uliginosibacterium gangwonense]
MSTTCVTSTCTETDHLPRPPLTGVILAGGASRRMGGQDKGLVPFQGQALVAWLVGALRPQVDELIIVANRNQERYAEFGCKVISDLRPDYPGPLAGFEAALTAAHSDWILTCPTDAPHLPPDYAELMWAASQGRPTVAVIDQHWQPVFSLIERSRLAALTHSLDAGERGAHRWLATLNPQLVSLDHRSAQFRDADTLAELMALAQTQTQPTVL